MRKFLTLLLCALLWTGQAFAAAGINWWDGSTWRHVVTPYWWDGSTYRTIVDGWRWDGSAWRPTFSTITVTASGVVGSGSGNSTSGNVFTSRTLATTGGSPIGSPTFSWTYVSGDPGITVSDAVIANPFWFETITGVTSGNTVTHNAIWEVVTTDPATGISSAPASIGIGVSWHNTGSTLSVSATGCVNDVNVIGPHTQVISCSGTSTPSGGTGVYTSYSWTCVTDCGPISIANPNVQNPTFSATLSTCGGGCTNSVSSGYTVTVTDSGGAMATSSGVTVELSITQLNG